MKTVTKKQLRAHLSEYTDEAERGEVVRVTDRGRLSVEIRSVNPLATAEQRRRASREFVDRLAERVAKRGPSSITPEHSQEILDELREGRF